MMGALMRSFDWSATSLGPPDNWPQSLRTSTGICLGSPWAALVFWGPDLVTLCNDAFADILGEQHPAALGRPGPEVWPGLAGPLRGVLQTGQPAFADDVPLVVQRNGRTEEVRLRFSFGPVHDESGGALGVFAQVSDSAEKVLDRYRLLSQHTRDIVLFVRLDGRIADANAAAVAAYGYERDELLRRTIFELRDPATTVVVPGQMFQADSQGITFETRHRRCDGTTFPVEVSSRGADVAGERLLLSIVRDITDRQQAEAELRASEARYRDLFENANDLIYTLDLEGRLTSVNKRAEQTFGYTCEECLGRNVAELIPPEQHEGMVEALRRTRAGTTSPTVYELELICKDGWRVPLEVSSRLIVRDGAPVGIQGIARDISDRRQTEQALREANRRKDEFLATLAHELRNPLAPIRTAAAVLGVIAPPGEEFQRLRDMIDRQVTHLVGLVDDLLDVSRISHGKVLLRTGPRDLVALLRAAVLDHQALLDKAGLRLAVEMPDRPVWVEGDSTRLAQVASNLLHNASKFTDAGGLVHIHLEEDSGEAVLTVRDTGIGMNAEVLGQLFEPCSQASQSIDRSRSGLGLGLALVKGLVELHGGTVRAASAGPGQGSAFTVRLPLCRPVPGPETDAPAAAPAGRPLRVLVVEDNRDAAESLRILLELDGHQVEVAHDGNAGVEAARLFCPEVVLCDIGLPGGMDGHAVARALQTEGGSRAVLIALSGYGQQEDQHLSRQAGFEHHLTKPVDPATLRQLLASLSKGGER
jgi:PAS domain S-box-containing protein